MNDATAIPKTKRGKGRLSSKQRAGIEIALKAGMSQAAIVGMGYPYWLVRRVMNERK